MQMLNRHQTISDQAREMKDNLLRNMRARFDAYNDLIADCDENILQEKIDAPKHKSLVEHLWCVIGARESYALALEAGEWQGFSCSLTQFSKDDVAEKLRESSTAVISVIEAIEDWSDARDELLLTLNEHEVMHEGQIIRHMYGLGYEMPDSIKWA
jgi:uncharacterized protein with PhoU and TrkA domain